MNKKQFLYLVLAFLLGAVWFITLRVISIQDKSTHYHANVAIYVNGQRDPLDLFTQYEEVQACSGEGTSPKGRAHLHKPNNDVVHVHDDAVTWSAFFANIGYGITNKAFTNIADTYVDGIDAKKLTFILNGQKVDTITNRVIEDKDALLVSYGSEDATALQQQYDGIRKNAEEVDKQFDPASCSGTKPLTLWDRIIKAVDPSQ
ncbi:hypothetical protein EB118_01720 [bacterium]|nr:hypothetical protein [bacterium]NBX97950.1 hypothetical protein [bacterium]NDC94622.1 hypothetical protein [bacterium]NDD83787.1 hypothetical protein [bacterium]NDG28806.1 hypothetical protein [bacterium]